VQDCRGPCPERKNGPKYKAFREEPRFDVEKEIFLEFFERSVLPSIKGGIADTTFNVCAFCSVKFSKVLLGQKSVQDILLYTFIKHCFERNVQIHAFTGRHYVLIRSQLLSLLFYHLQIKKNALSV